MSAVRHGKPASQRKREQLEVCLQGGVSGHGATNGLERYRFRHQALPEVNFEQIDTGTTFLGKRLRAPLLISPMVGGTPEAELLNHRLAAAAQELGLALGVGSERCAIEDQTALSSFQVRQVAPDILLFANLGAVQLNYGYGLAECRRAVEMIAADGLVLHLNPLQEALQEGGNTNFAGLLPKIRAVCQGLGKPVVVKEVGWGLAEDTARALAAAGVAALDVAGAGGTAWGEVERKRARSATLAGVAASFAGWGLPTAEAVIQARRGAPQTPLIASGGLRTGLEVAQTLALGADVASVGLPLLQAANKSAEALRQALDELIYGLRLAMFAIGAPSIMELRNTTRLERVA